MLSFHLIFRHVKPLFDNRNGIQIFSRTLIIMIWPDFCSALIVGRLAPLGSRNTRFRSVPVSCSPGAGADASGPRHETHRNVADSGSLGSRKGSCRQTRVLYAPSALPAMAVRVAGRAGRGRHAGFPDPGGVHEADAPRAMAGTAHETVRAAMRGGPMIPPVPAPAAPPGVHGGGARPAGEPAGEHVGGLAVQPKRPLAMRTQAMPATCGRSGRPASNHQTGEAGPAARAPRRSGGDGRPTAAHAADSRFPHDVHHPAAAGPGRVPALRRRPGARLAAPVHGHEETGMDLEDATGRRPAGRPAPGTVPEPVDASDHQRRAGPSLAAKRSRRRRQYPVRAPQSRDPGPRTPQLRHRVPGRLPGLRRDHGTRPVAPTAQRLRRGPRIPGGLFDRPGLRRTRAARLRQQPDGLRPELRRASRALRHGPIISHRAKGNAKQKNSSYHNQ